MHRRQDRQQLVLRAERHAATIHRDLQVFDQRVEIGLVDRERSVRFLHVAAAVGATAAEDRAELLGQLPLDAIVVDLLEERPHPRVFQQDHHEIIHQRGHAGHPAELLEHAGEFRMRRRGVGHAGRALLCGRGVLRRRGHCVENDARRCERHEKQKIADTHVHLRKGHQKPTCSEA